MDLIKLDPTSYLGTSNIIGWTNCIWTERFRDAGEFELRTPRISETMNLIPEGSLVSLRDSSVVMEVEDHNVEADEDGVETLVTTGRTVEAVWLEGRYIDQAPYKKPAKMQGNSGTYNAITAAAALVWDAIMNNTGNSILVFPTQARPAYDVIPNLHVTLTRTIDQTAQEWWIENGPIYPVVMDFLVRYGAGIRIIRPPFIPNGLTSGTLAITFYSSGEAVAVTPQQGTRDRMKFDFYVGVNRTEGQSAVTPVIFDYQRGHLERDKYLFSSRNLRNIAGVDTSTGKYYVVAPGTPGLTGRQLKYLYIDGGDKPSDMSAADFQNASIQKGQIELAKYNRIAAMEADVTLRSPYKYKTDYDLGDKVTLRGRFGLRQTMQVTEYVRASDGTTEIGAPTLSLPS